MSQIAVILLTASLSSIFTITLGFFFIRRILREHTDQAAQKYLDKLKSEIGPTIEESIKKGVKDGITAIPSREVIRETTRTIAKTSADIVGDTLKPLLNRRTRNRDDRDS